MTAEQIISDTLNGWFFRLNVGTGKVSAETVPFDFIPDHTPAGWNAEEGGHKNNNGQAFPWTPEQDAQLIELRSSGLTWPAIGAHFGCSNKTVLWRHARLVAGEV